MLKTEVSTLVKRGVCPIYNDTEKNKSMDF